MTNQVIKLQQSISKIKPNAENPIVIFGELFSALSMISYFESWNINGDNIIYIPSEIKQTCQFIDDTMHSQLFETIENSGVRILENVLPNELQKNSNGSYAVQLIQSEKLFLHLFFSDCYPVSQTVFFNCFIHKTIQPHQIVLL